MFCYTALLLVCKSPKVNWFVSFCFLAPCNKATFRLYIYIYIFPLYIFGHFLVCIDLERTLTNGFEAILN